LTRAGTRSRWIGIYSKGLGHGHGYGLEPYGLGLGFDLSGRDYITGLGPWSRPLSRRKFAISAAIILAAENPPQKVWLSGYQPNFDKK